MAIVPKYVWLCDVCLDDGREVEATHRDVPVTIGDDPTRALTVCDGHHAEILGPARAALAKYGTKPGQAPRPSRRPRANQHRKVGPFRCLVDGCVSTPLKHRSSLNQHVRGIHGMTLAEYIEQHGEPVQMTPEEVASFVVEVVCPFDDCRRSFSSADGHRWPQQSLRNHMIGAHQTKPEEMGLTNA